jgi:bacillithiol biosynthesis cysteine-adding enzyme BshC
MSATLSRQISNDARGAAFVKAQCLPFTQIPHTTKLFGDFLYDFPKVSRFYPRPPRYSAWLSAESQTIQYDAERRRDLAAVVSRQNRGWGASEKTMANIARLEQGALAAVTGQQVGLFGGPLFTIFKVLSAVQLAEEASAQGIPTVPIFWLATADHDLAEINHTFFCGANGEIQYMAMPSEGTGGAAVGGIRLGDEIVALVERMAALLGESEATHWLRAAYRPGETFGSAFAKFYAQVFAGLGLIVLDPNDPALHALASPIYTAAVEQATNLNEALMQRGQQLIGSGYHDQVQVTPSSTTLFSLHNGVRTAIHRAGSHGGNDSFEIAGEKVSREELLRRIASKPGNFSPNALLRPVVQDSLLPTLAYFGGPAEVAYFAQSAVLYEKLLGRVTPILPRFSATLIDAKQSGLLERYGLTLTDLYAGPESVLREIANRTLAREIHSEFEAAQQTVDQSLISLRMKLEHLDPTLTDAAERAGRKIRYQLTRLRQRAANAEMHRTEIFSRHAALLSHGLCPRKALQERELGGAQFLARHGVQLLSRLLENVSGDCLDHQILFV